MIPGNHRVFIDGVHDIAVVVVVAVNYTLLLPQRREVGNNSGCPGDRAMCRIRLSLCHLLSLKLCSVRWVSHS
jgi:hypothetical protein